VPILGKLDIQQHLAPKKISCNNRWVELNYDATALGKRTVLLDQQRQQNVIKCPFGHDL